MSIQKTDMKEVRGVAKTLLHVDIVPSELDLFVMHPFTSSRFVYMGNDLVDIFSEDGLSDWLDYTEDLIDKADLIRLLMYVDKKYRLLFLKLCMVYVTPADFSSMLASAWVGAEHVSSDVNVSISELKTMLKYCNRADLMDEDELEEFDKLADSITIYRGVTHINNTKFNALSWTLNKDKAEWFATRFGAREGSQLWETTIPKSKVLAYFSGRGESEIVVAPTKKDIRVNQLYCVG